MPRARRHALVFLAISLYCLLVLPRMLSYGMFIDGGAYASMARNMAENYGSFWQPYYTATVYPTFYEHAPLGFWLQSWAYRLYGDSIVIILIMTLMISFGLLLSTNTASVHFFKRYVRQQVLASVAGAPATWTSRFDVLTVVSRESLVPLLVGGTLADPLSSEADRNFLHTRSSLLVLSGHCFG